MEKSMLLEVIGDTIENRIIDILKQGSSGKTDAIIFIAAIALFLLFILLIFGLTKPP